MDNSKVEMPKGRRYLGCGGPLVVVGNARANGKAGRRDWAARRYHTGCVGPAVVREDNEPDERPFVFSRFRVYD